MDDFTVDVLNTVDRDTLPDQDDREDARPEPVAQAAAAAAGEQPSPRRWKGLAALRERANVQDKLLEKYVGTELDKYVYQPCLHMNISPLVHLQEL